MTYTVRIKPIVTTTIQKYDYIDVLRGLAILLVIAVHSEQQIEGLPTLWASLFNYGQLGVQLFFVASALTLCLSMKGRNENYHIIKFYIRRVFRIAPVYYFGIVLYFFWRTAKGYYKSQALQMPDSYNFIGVLENIFFLHGFDPRNFNFVVPGGWSVATEMTFYAIFPFLYLLQNKLGAKRFIIFSAVTIGLSFVIQYSLIFLVQPILIDYRLLKGKIFNDGFGFIYCSIFNQISVFLIGIITYQSLGKVIINKVLIGAFLLLSVFSYYLLNATILSTGMNGFMYPILSSVSFLILALWLSNPKHKFKSKISRMLINVGRVSFSMYLLHFLLIDVLRFIYVKFIFVYLTSTISQLFIFYLSLTAITYYFSKLTFMLIEKPGINFGNRIILKLYQKKELHLCIPPLKLRPPPRKLDTLN